MKLLQTEIHAGGCNPHGCFVRKYRPAHVMVDGAVAVRSAAQVPLRFDWSWVGRHEHYYKILGRGKEMSCVLQSAGADCFGFSPRGNHGQRGAAVTTKRVLTAAVLVGITSVMVLAQSTNPLVGTWNLNVAKSKAPFKSGTTIVQAMGDGIRFSVDLVGTDGTKSHWEFTANYDGKDNPVTGDSPYGDTVAVTRVDERTTRIVGKHGGKPTTTHTIVVSADGKTRTSAAKGTDKAGKPVDSVSFYERQ